MKTRVHSFAFEVFGVGLRLESPSKELLGDVTGTVTNFFPGGVKVCAAPRSLQHRVFFSGAGKNFRVESELGAIDIRKDIQDVEKFVRTMVRVIIARNAPEHLFIHAGVVSVNKRAIVIPGDSHCGKTTLVAEFVKSGAEYYSDEYAILDKLGRVNPFPKPLSMRGIDGPEVQTDVHIKSLNGSQGRRKLLPSTVLFTSYQRGARWRPSELGPGDGILKLIPHAIAFAERPQFSLPLLQKGFKNAQFFESPRGDAGRFVVGFLETLDK